MAGINAVYPAIYNNIVDIGLDNRSGSQWRTTMVTVGSSTISAGGICKTRLNNDYGGIFGNASASESRNKIFHRADWNNRRNDNFN